MIENVILGGGIAGIAAAYRARMGGKKAFVLEAQSRPGGLLDSFGVDGFVFDRAVHLSFASEPEVRAVFDRTPYITHRPDSPCFDDGLWIRHPAQNNMFPLSTKEKIELIAGLAAHPITEVRNYRDWLIYQYGEPIAKRWPLIYTEKYWTVPAEELGTDWIGARMRRADLREVLEGAFSKDTPSTYYIKEMRYPERGGYRAFLEPMINEVEIHCNHRVIEIDARGQTVGIENGTKIQYQTLISTLPLPLLIEMLPNAPEDVRAAAATLFTTEIDLISVAFNRPRVSPALWFYIYDRDILAARAYAPDWKSPNNVPAGCSALQFEIYSSRKLPQKHSPDELKANTVQALIKMNIASEKDIIFVHHTHVPYANVVFDLGMEQRRDLVRKWVESQGIHLAGRFGEWDYLWSHQAMMSGYHAAERAFELSSHSGPQSAKYRV
jgi:protoporphyrinogen oxidase